MSFDIVERFFTLSGEAPLAGRPCYLVRFARCNLACAYCDTGYKDEVRETLGFAELVAEIGAAMRGYPGAFTLLTGGEPLLGERREGVSALAAALPETEFHVETNGSIEILDFGKANLRYVVDWKTESSGCPGSFVAGNLARMRAGLDCVKIVVASSDLPDLARKVAFVKEANPGIEVFLSPQWGKIGLEELAAFILDRKLPSALSLQLHKIIWGDRRGV